jgi:GT2 family glycosyltransferase
MELNKIYMVVILYKESLEDSKTIRTLNLALSVTTNILVFDNSPKRQYKDSFFIYDKFKVHYYHDSSNKGLSFAYNYALKLANKNHYPWLMLLDQDTTFTKEYISSITTLDSKTISNNTVALIPQIKDFTSNKEVSPSKMYKGGVCKPLKVLKYGTNMAITSINSGTILKTSYLNTINGFNEDYSLDMLDHSYFREMYRDSKSVYLMNCTIYQDLSVFDVFEDNVSLIRYQQMLLAEMHFVKEEGFLSILIFKIRLLRRCIKQLKYKNKEYYKLTLKIIF